MISQPLLTIEPTVSEPQIFEVNDTISCNNRYRAPLRFNFNKVPYPPSSNLL